MSTESQDHPAEAAIREAQSLASIRKNDSESRTGLKFNEFLNMLSNVDINLLEQIRAVAVEGMSFGRNEYDLNRYKRIIDILAVQYSTTFDQLPKDVLQSFLRERGCITPKVGVEVVISDENANLLVLKRADDNRWGLPGGWVDIGESPEHAGVREAFEEAGVEVCIKGYLAVTSKGPEVFPGFAHQVNILLVSAPISSGSKIRLTHEHNQSQWIRDDGSFAWHAGHDTLARLALAFLANPTTVPILPIVRHTPSQ